MNGHHSPKNGSKQQNGFMRPNLNGHVKLNGSLDNNHGRNKSNSGEGSNISSNMSSNSTLTIDKNTSDNDETLILEDQNPSTNEQNENSSSNNNNNNQNLTTSTTNKPTNNSNISSANTSFNTAQNSDNESAKHLNVSDEEIVLDEQDSGSSSSDEEFQEGSRTDRVPTPPRLYLKDPLDAKSGRQVLMNQNSKINITDFTDWLDGEDAISKHIHLTSALIILNIVGFCVIANDRKPIKKILKHRELLARLAFSKMDCASQISKLLFEADKGSKSLGQNNVK